MMTRNNSNKASLLASSRKPSTVKKKLMKTPRDAYGRSKQNRAAPIVDIESSGSGSGSVGRGKSWSFDRNHSTSKSSGDNHIDTNTNNSIAMPACIHQYQSTAIETSTATNTKNNPHNPYKTKSNIPPSSAKFNQQLKH